jgi:hypothetical protein
MRKEFALVACSILTTNIAIYVRILAIKVTFNWHIAEYLSLPHLTLGTTFSIFLILAILKSGKVVRSFYEHEKEGKVKNSPIENIRENAVDALLCFLFAGMAYACKFWF